MKIMYVNDLRLFPNWGCRATGVALSQLIENEHEVIERVGRETGNNSGWNAYAEPMIRLGGVLPGALTKAAWHIRRELPRTAKLIFLMDALAGARHDFVTEDPIESVRKFHRIRKQIPRLNEIYASLKVVDAVVINGEGTMIFRRPMARDALFLMFMMALAHSEGKPIYFLNAMFSDCPVTGHNHKAVERTKELLEVCESVVCRDKESFGFVSGLSPDIAVGLLPDALFTWQDKIVHARETIAQNPNLCLAFGNDDLVDRLDFRAPYICLAGSSLIRKRKVAVEAYSQLATSLVKLGLPVILIQTCIGDSFLSDVAQATKLPLISAHTSVLAGAAIVAGAAAFVTGRFHPAIMASCGGTPCVFLGSNSHKNLTLQDVLRYETKTHYSSIPSVQEIGLITAEVERVLATGVSRRKEISDIAMERSRQAHSVVEMLRTKGRVPPVVE